MPKKRRPDPLYQRGKYALYARPGRAHEIIWYDPVAGRERSKSAGTTDRAAAENELDRLYLERERGQSLCPTCGQPVGTGGYFINDSIADYILARETRPSISAIRARLRHVTNYLEASGQDAAICEDVDADWIDAFREWMIEIPVLVGKTETRDRAPGTVEASVRQLAAAINYSHRRKDTLHPAAFSPKPPAEVDRTPMHRSTVDELAAMFKYAIAPNLKTGKPRADRIALHRFLQFSVATLCRPDAAYDFSTDPDRRQWHPDAGVIALNPKGRMQTRKYRPMVPAANHIVPIINATNGHFVPVGNARKSFEAMRDELKLPTDGEAGQKLIRRSMATILRGRMDAGDWWQIEMFLGHRKFHPTSTLYAGDVPAMMNGAKAAIEAVIDEIETLAPGAFYRNLTAVRKLKSAH